MWQFYLIYFFHIVCIFTFNNPDYTSGYCDLHVCCVEECWRDQFQGTIWDKSLRQIQRLGRGKGICRFDTKRSKTLLK